MAFKFITAEEAAEFIHHNDNVGFSGFTAAGTPKVVSVALAKKAEAGEFAEEKYYEFIEMIMRSYDYKDFMNCWNMFNSDTKLNISEELYSDIRSQSEYYCNLCAMLYIKDMDN